jgi:glycosyltransferase involved in cell wall biosynthesis
VLIERTRLVRVAVNVEQLLYRAPGGIGRYTAKLVTLLPHLFPNDGMVPFVARHRPDAVRAAYEKAGLLEAGTALPVRLPIPRPVLYDAWHTVGRPRLDQLSSALGDCSLIHAPSVAVPPKGRARLVVTVHDVAPLLYPETFPARGRWFHARGIKAAARRADLVIAVSQSAAQELESHTAIPAERVRVVPNGVDATPVPPAQIADTVRRYGLDGRRYVLWVGSLEPRKNVGTLVSAFAGGGEKELADITLVLVGPSGWLDNDLISPHDRDALGERLRLLGYVPDQDLRGLLAGADVFAFPSRHEGFGLPLLEAMAQGTPVVAADIPALREVAGGAASLVDPMDRPAWADALASLLADGERRATLAELGRRRAGAFSWEATVQATHAVYVEALGG